MPLIMPLSIVFYIKMIEYLAFCNTLYLWWRYNSAQTCNCGEVNMKFVPQINHCSVLTLFYPSFNLFNDLGKQIIEFLKLIK